MKKLLLYISVILFAICSVTLADAPKKSKKIENVCSKLVNYYNIQPFIFGERAQICRYKYKINAKWNRTKTYTLLLNGWDILELVGKRDTLVYRYEKEISCLDGKDKCPPFRIACFARNAKDLEKRVLEKKIIYALYLSNMSYHCDDYISWTYEGSEGYLCDDSYIDNKTYDERFCTR